MDDKMIFPDTVEEFMEQYKIVDTKHVYTNGVALVPIFRMKQWFEHLNNKGPAISNSNKTGEWISLGHIIGFMNHPDSEYFKCSLCGYEQYVIYDYPPIRCPRCNASMTNGKEIFRINLDTRE